MRLFGDDVLMEQRLLRAAGLLHSAVDGVWGPMSEAAAVQFAKRFEEIRAREGEFDARTEACIRTLVPRAQELARRSLTVLRKSGIDARIISGTRSYKEQDALFRKGRTSPGVRVTNARGGQSNHNFGIAWDIGVFDAKGKYVGDGAVYERAGRVVLAAMRASIEWGGEWRSFPDVSHFQVRTGLGMAELRRRFEGGVAFV